MDIETQQRRAFSSFSSQLDRITSFRRTKCIAVNRSVTLSLTVGRTSFQPVIARSSFSPETKHVRIEMDAGAIFCDKKACVHASCRGVKQQTRQKRTVIFIYTWFFINVYTQQQFVSPFTPEQSTQNGSELP